MNKRTDESSVKVSEPRLVGLKLEILTCQTASRFFSRMQKFPVPLPAVFSRTILDCFTRLTPEPAKRGALPPRFRTGAGPGVLRNSQFTSMRLAEMAI